MIKNDSGDEFRRRYRAVDVLLMDDVQFVAGKEGLQEELFQTLNELFHNGIQLVLTCDVHPRWIPTLTDRLVNRVASGFLVELQTPDLQTRLDILRRKAALEHVVVPDDVLQLLASGLQCSIREMEGALVRLVALHRLLGAPLIPAVGEQVLCDVLLATRSARS
jgi:chromosomal replication initiator protein